MKITKKAAKLFLLTLVCVCGILGAKLETKADTRPENPDFITATIEKNGKFRIVWDKVEGVDGYEISYSTSPMKYIELKDVKQKKNEFNVAYVSVPDYKKYNEIVFHIVSYENGSIRRNYAYGDASTYVKTSTKAKKHSLTKTLSNMKYDSDKSKITWDEVDRYKADGFICTLKGYESHPKIISNDTGNYYPGLDVGTLMSGTWEIKPFMVTKKGKVRYGKAVSCSVK